MLTTLVLWAALTDGGPQPDAAGLLAAAESAAARGDAAESRRLLGEAVEAAPAAAAPRWRSGQVRDGKRWEFYDEVSARLAGDPKYAEYVRRRDAMPDDRDAAAHDRLARWCRQVGLEAEASGHWEAAATLNPRDVRYHRALGRRDLHGAWMTPEEIRRTQQDLAALRRADFTWTQALNRLVFRAKGGDEKAAAEFAAVRDPLAVPSLERIAAANGPSWQRRAVAAASAIWHQAAADSLIRHAVLPDSPAVRADAAAGLAKRNPIYFVPRLVDFLSVGRFDVGTFDVPFGGLEGRHAIAWYFTVGVRTHVELFTVADSLDLARAQAAARVARRAEAESLAIPERDRRIVDALEASTGQKLGDDAPKWRSWLANLTDSYMSPQALDPPSQVVSVGQTEVVGTQPTGTDCFVPGTPVWTRRGPAPIEKVRVGDLLLSQDVDSGELAWRPVTVVQWRPAARLLRLAAGGAEVTATSGHPFRVPGRGWVMAKDLKAGDVLRAADGVARVDRLEPAGRGGAVSLTVAGFGSYFVGAGRWLVHDNSPVYDLELPSPTAVEAAADR